VAERSRVGVDSDVLVALDCNAAIDRGGGIIDGSGHVAAIKEQGTGVGARCFGEAESAAASRTDSDRAAGCLERSIAVVSHCDGLITRPAVVDQDIGCAKRLYLAGCSGEGNGG